MRSSLKAIKVSDRGVYVQASTLGSLEALLEFLKTSKIPVILFNVAQCQGFIPVFCAFLTSSLIFILNVFLCRD